jgi:hypothetical protein
MTTQQQPATIDLTPTWQGVLPILIAALEDGTKEGKKLAREELRRMAKAADTCKDNLQFAVYRIQDMLLEDDGQAFKEARKFVEDMKQKGFVAS